MRDLNKILILWCSARRSCGSAHLTSREKLKIDSWTEMSEYYWLKSVVCISAGHILIFAYLFKNERKTQRHWMCDVILKGWKKGFFCFSRINNHVVFSWIGPCCTSPPNVIITATIGRSHLTMYIQKHCHQVRRPFKHYREIVWKKPWCVATKSTFNSFSVSA